MTLCFDENLSYQIPMALRVLGEAALHVNELCPKGTKDPEMLMKVAGVGGVLVTRDDAIRTNRFENAVVREHHLCLFVLSGKKLDRCAILQSLARHLPEMKAAAQSVKPPAVFILRPNGAKFTRVL
jgi:hypothetical protein